MKTTQINSQIEKIRDPKFFLESFTKIKGKVPGMMPFILNEAQKDLFNTLNTKSRVMILKARQMGFCQDPKTRVLTSDLQWITLDDITIGQEIIAVDEEPIGRGKGSSRKMRTAVIQNKSEVFAEGYKITMEDGRELTLTGSHKMLMKTIGGDFLIWKEAKDMKVGQEIRYITKPWSNNRTFEDGWFSGLIDGEGCLHDRKNSSIRLTVSQVAGNVFDRAKKYLLDGNYNFKLEVDKRLPGKSSKLGSKEVHKVVIGRMDELFMVLGKTTPSRFMGRHFWEGRELPGKRSGIGWEKITKIELLPKQRMIDLQTSEKTYIAEGFVSHNSTAVTGFLFHKTMTTPGTNTALIGYNSDLTAELLDKVKTFYQTMPTGIRPRIQYNSKYEISFPDPINSKILVLPSSENVGRGYTLHNVLCTELAFWEKADEKMLAIENAVPADGKIIIESTPNAIGNLYHRMWMADNGYEKKQYGWWWGYTEEQIDVIRRRINNPMKFAQEYGLEFLSSGRPVFASDLIKRLRKGIYKIGDKVKDENGVETTVTQNEDGLIMYSPPRPGRTYVAGADVAEGVTGGDYSVMTIFDRENGEEVAFWRGYIPPDRFGGLLNKFGRFYNNALMVVEINNHGLTTVTALKNLMYPQLYFQPAKFDKMGTSYSDRLGWKTSKVTRPLMIDDLREALADGSYKIHTEKTLDEMLTFVFDDGGNMVTQSSFHDDCIFASAICFQGFKVSYSGKLEQISYEDHMPSNFSY